MPSRRFGRHLNTRRFLFVPGDALADLLGLKQEDIKGFASHWPRLTPDRYILRSAAADSQPGALTARTSNPATLIGTALQSGAIC
jgi:hypothetical protein